MNNRDKILREIISDQEIMEKYNIKESEIENLKCNPPYSNKVIEVMATIINEYDNNRTARQIYSTIKNLHKI